MSFMYAQREVEFTYVRQGREREREPTEFGLKLHRIASIFNIHKYLHENSNEVSTGHFVCLKQYPLRVCKLQYNHSRNMQG